MKTLITLLLFALPSLLFAQEKATIYIFRATGFAGSAMNAPINLDTKDCGLGNNKYTKIEVAPGTYFLSTHKDKDPIKIQIDSGNYYFDIRMKMGVLSARYILSEITERGAKEYFDNDKMLEKDNCFD